MVAAEGGTPTAMVVERNVPTVSRWSRYVSVLRENTIINGVLVFLVIFQFWCYFGFGVFVKAHVSQSLTPI